ncbi:uncharacterized protein LOC129319002 [Prosopis cineraria]|uniref:uncharacterized protein LOC129319002 n=1 Tax=Prosopis cineraria TaxID=364024 RepID=UPI0024102BA9|nr:uncharacterized protein LOC129319002 [Prosopis cineraria]
MASFYSNPLHCSPISDRVCRALQQDLQLLHRSYSTFFVLSAIGNVFTVTLSAFPCCSCPDSVTPRKHILFVLIRLLGVSPDSVFLLQNTLFPFNLCRLLDQPTSPDALANAPERSSDNVAVEYGTSCPICLDEMKNEEKLVTCGTCWNAIHERCFVRWKGSKVNRVISCVICRAPWDNNNEDYDQHMYLNLSAYTRQRNN